MEAYQLRVIEEKRKLDSDLEKLQTFLKSDIFGSISSAEQERLNRQSRIMSELSGVLGERIAAF